MATRASWAGRRSGKDALRIESYGTIDELSACLGLARTELSQPGAPDGAARAGAICCCASRTSSSTWAATWRRWTSDRRPTQPVIEARHTTALEQQIDAWNADLPELRSFVLPGGGRVAAALHLARTVCRRAERIIVRLGDAEPISPAVIPYVNRLSDALFVMSRHAARIYGEAEPLWQPEKT